MSACPFVRGGRTVPLTLPIMTSELLFTVVGSSAEPAAPISLADAGLKERADLQEWVIARPEILGPEVKIVTFEFDRWWTTSGPPPQDRLDVLGLDADGRLVVVELKRDRAPDTTELQSIKYAAMASRFTVSSLADQYVRFRANRKDPLTTEEALAELQEHASELSAETLRRPRIVLLAREYPPVLTASVVWLSEMGIDISLMQFQAYRATAPDASGQPQSQVLVSVSQLYPVRDVEEFTVSPERQQIKEAAETRKRVQDVSTVKRLVDANAVADGTVFTISPRNDINPEMREQVDQYLDAEPKRRSAVWQNKATRPLMWQGDDAEYSPSGLVGHIVAEATGIHRGFYGTVWWRDPSGKTLVELAAPYASARNERYRMFWARWLDRIKAEHPGWTQMTVAPPQNWVTLPCPVKGAVFGNSFAAGGKLRSELYIDTGNAEANAALFTSLQAKSNDIEADFGRPLVWEELPGKQACRVAEYADGDVSRTDDFEDYINWFFESSERMRKAFGAGAVP